MTLQTTTPQADYVENGVTLTHPIPFQFIAATDIVCSRILAGVETVLTLGADYSVAGGAGDTGTVTKTSPGSNGTVFRIKRQTTRAQPMDYTPGDAFPAESHEAALDRLAAVNQEQDVAIDDLERRTIRVPVGELAPTLPTKAQMAGEYLAGDADGNIVPSSGTGNDPNLRSDLGNVGGDALVAVKRAEGGAVARTLQARLRDTVSAMDFGAVGDGSANDWAAITAALATGKMVLLPKTPGGQYNIGSPLHLTGAMSLVSEDGVVLHYTGTTDAALVLSGNANFVKIGEVNAPLAPYAVRYYNLQYSRIDIRRPGSCTVACIYHDATSQTVDAGNNRWVLGDVQAGGVLYGMKIDSHATYTLEGEDWNVEVIFSATACSAVIGSLTGNTVRFNHYNISFDCQAITPLALAVNNDLNGIHLDNWSALPAAAFNVSFATGTIGNYLYADPGVQGQLRIQDNGDNAGDWPNGLSGERIIGGKRGHTVLNDAGGTPIWSENRSKAAATTKYVRHLFRGHDSVDTQKDVGAVKFSPQDQDWVSTSLILSTRLADALTDVVFIGINGTPEGQITAPVGAIATRRDGGASTTFYVKQSGAGNTGWIAK